MHIFHKKDETCGNLTNTVTFTWSCFCFQLMALATLSLVCVDTATIRTLTLNGPTTQGLPIVHTLDQKAITPMEQVMHQLSSLYRVKTF